MDFNDKSNLRTETVMDERNSPFNLMTYTCTNKLFQYKNNTRLGYPKIDIKLFSFI
jgi:hypothetical protein